MVRTFRNRALQSLWNNGDSFIDRRFQKRILIRLDRLNIAVTASDMNLPGYSFHSLKGFAPTRYSIHVNGPWCLTFEFEDENAYRVDFEQYH